MSPKLPNIGLVAYNKYYLIKLAGTNIGFEDGKVNSEKKITFIMKRNLILRKYKRSMNNKVKEKYIQNKSRARQIEKKEKKFSPNASKGRSSILCLQKNHEKRETS